MKLTFGKKRINVKLKPRFADAIESMAASIKETASGVNMVSNDAGPLKSEDQINWRRTIHCSDKLMGIYEIAKLSTGSTTFADIIIFLSSIGIRVYEPVPVANTKVLLMGDAMCISGEGDNISKFYTYITMAPSAEIDAATLTRFCDEAKIFNLNPVIIAPFGLSSLTGFIAESLNIEVIGKDEMENIHKGIEAKKTGKVSLTDEILKEVSKL